MSSSRADATALRRDELRIRLLQARRRYVGAPGYAAAEAALRVHLKAVVDALEPQRLGLYWPIRSEFNAVEVFVADGADSGLPLALPFAQRQPRQMHYRAWDRRPPAVDDECAIPTSGGAPVMPDVVLVPCLGYTKSAFRLGYGAGYFDRWMAAHPQVTAVGVAFSIGEIDAASGFEPLPHDQPLALVVTEEGVVA